MKNIARSPFFHAMYAACAYLALINELRMEAASLWMLLLHEGAYSSAYTTSCGFDLERGRPDGSRLKEWFQMIVI